MKIQKTRRYGITQAQTILILGIVGLFLFAFVIVPFYKSFKQKNIVSKLKLVHTELVQADRMYSIISSDSKHEWDMNLSASDFARTYFSPYLHSLKGYCNEAQDRCWNPVQYKDLRYTKFNDKITYSLILKNGEIIGFGKDKNNLVSLYVDINGASGENKLGKDVFIFSFYNPDHPPKICDKSVYEQKYVKPGIHFGGYDQCGIPFDAYTYAELYDEKLPDGCNKKAPRTTEGSGVGSACLALIYAGNWAIDKKYPW